MHTVISVSVIGDSGHGAAVSSNIQSKNSKSFILNGETTHWEIFNG